MLEDSDFVGKTSDNKVLRLTANARVFQLASEDIKQGCSKSNSELPIRK